MMYVIPDRKNIDPYLQLNACFEYNDFIMNDLLDHEEEIRNIISFYKSLNRDRSKDTMHGSFMDITIHSSDSKIREISRKRVFQSMDIAKDLGVKGIVFHTNTIPNFTMESYIQNWLELNVSFWKEVLNKYSEIEIYIENMFDMDGKCLYELMKRVDHERFGVCFDYAHACVYGKHADWSCVIPYIKHVHINDNHLIDDEHLPVGSGDLNWKELKPYLINSPSILIEVNGIESIHQSIEFIKNHKVFGV